MDGGVDTQFGEQAVLRRHPGQHPGWEPLRPGACDRETRMSLILLRPSTACAAGLHATRGAPYASRAIEKSTGPTPPSAAC